MLMPSKCTATVSPEARQLDRTPGMGCLAEFAAPAPRSHFGWNTAAHRATRRELYHRRKGQGRDTGS